MVGREDPVVKRRDRPSSRRWSGGTGLDACPGTARGVKQWRGAGKQQFLWTQLLQLFFDAPLSIVSGKFSRAKLAGGKIKGSKSRAIAGDYHCSQKVVFFCIERRVCRRSRGDHAGHLA